MPPIGYVVTPIDLNAHVYAVRLDVPVPDPAGQLLRLPNWIRGSYKIRDFARHIVALEALGPEGTLAVEKIDKASVRCAPCAGPLRVEYRVHAHDPSVREAFLDPRRGFFNPSSLCYEVLGQGATPCELLVERPATGTGGWHVATAMAPVEVDGDGYGRYQAADYETLIDHPFALGPMQRVDFEVDGIPHTLALTGRCAIDAQRLRADLAAVCGAERALFGHEPKLDRYLFLCDVRGAGYGGLEHRNSASLVCSREDLPAPGADSRSRAYRGFLGLVAHEYFHQWNVKRITPERFAESSLQAEAYTRDLWAYEGVTSYYDDLLLLHSGCVAAAEWLDLLAATATRYQRAPGRALQSLADSSFEAWSKYYQPDANTPNAVVSYYLKGALVALSLDLKLRRESQVSLDDVMRELWRRHGAVGKPVPEGGLERLAAECSGLDLGAFFDHALRTVEPLPLVETLADFGVNALLRVSSGAKDRGGRASAAALRVDAGLRWSADGKRVIHVRSGSAAELAGVSPGDEIVSLDGLRVTASTWQAQLDALGAPGGSDAPNGGAEVPMHYFRSDELFSTMLAITAAAADTWVFTLADDCAEDVAARRRAWLGV